MGIEAVLIYLRGHHRRSAAFGETTNPTLCAVDLPVLSPPGGQGNPPPNRWIAYPAGTPGRVRGGARGGLLAIFCYESPLMERCLRMRKDGRRGFRLPSSRLVEMPGIEPGSREVQHERLQACSAPPVSPVASSADRVGNGPAEVGVLTPFGARIGVSTPHSEISVARPSPLGEGARRT